MQAEKTYQGWKNYETWCVNLWLSNDEGLYNEARSLTRLAMETDTDDEPADAGQLAQNLKEWVESFPEVEAVTEQASFVSDLLRAALSEVDWYEIAASWIEGESE